ncbi:MAG: CvpA family protein [Desulfocucumaceae bacterium]
MNWLDILFLAIMAWYTWTGLRTGLVVGLAKLLGALIGLAAALNFYRPLADAVNLKWNLVSAIGKLLPLPGKATGAVPPGSQGPAEIFFPFVGSPGSPALPKMVSYSLHGIGESVTRMLASGILDILCFIILYLVVSKLVVVIGVVVSKMSRLLLLGPLDRAGGLVIGVVKGGIIVAILVAVIVSLQLPAAYIAGGQKPSLLSLALQKSTLAPFFFKALAYFKITFPGWPV